jgi:DHA1 family bicyclomycin/chloramphenicol resistance-like MFS transporter
MATLVGISSLGPFQFDTYLPALPALMLFLHTTDTMVQLTITASLLGMASGQLLVGPITDALGRRRPLIVALAVFILSAIACLLANSVEWMIFARFALGFSAAGGFVINNAFIRDIASGQASARLYSTQATIANLAPVVAPLVGGQLLLIGDWHIVFIFLALLGAAVLSAAVMNMPESLAPANRSPLTFGATFSAWRLVLADRRFVSLALTNGLIFGQICVFIAGAPFSLENDFHLSPTQYTFAFAMITFSMFSLSYLNRLLLRRFAAITMLRYGMIHAAIAGSYLTGMNLLGAYSLPVVVVGLALAVSSIGFCSANILGLAMRDHAKHAGVAAGLVGFSNSIIGAVVAPITSILFGLHVVGVTTFMSMLLFAAALIGLTSLRNEVGALR